MHVCERRKGSAFLSAGDLAERPATAEESGVLRSGSYDDVKGVYSWTNQPCACLIRKRS